MVGGGRTALGNRVPVPSTTRPKPVGLGCLVCRGSCLKCVHSTKGWLLVCWHLRLRITSISSLHLHLALPNSPPTSTQSMSVVAVTPGTSVMSLTRGQLLLSPASIIQPPRLVLPSADEAAIARFYRLASPADLFLIVAGVKSSRSRHRQILCLVRVLFLAYRQPPSGCVLVTKRKQAFISSPSKDTNHTVKAPSS